MRNVCGIVFLHEHEHIERFLNLHECTFNVKYKSIFHDF